MYSAIGPDGRAVAVKLLVVAASTTQELLSRATAQDGAADRAPSHPSLPRVLERSLSDPQQPYVVSELLDGETLEQRMNREPGLAEAELLEYGERVADILADLHAHRIVHGELGARHVFLCRSGEVKLLGLDLPWRLRPRADGSQLDACRTSRFVAEVAPEQASGQWDGTDGRADLFALGAILFAGFARRRADATSDSVEGAEPMRPRPAGPLASVAPTVPASICAVVDTALASSVDARYPNAATLGLDLRAVRNGLSPPFAAARLHATIQAVPATRLSERVRASLRARACESKAPGAGGADTFVGTVLAGRFRIDRHLGSGAMGSVYLARHVHIKKAVALKVLHREMSCEPEVVARFEREAIAAARIEHPNVAAARDFGRLEDGSFYLVLEYVEGESLRALLHREGPQTVAFSLAVSRQIALALEAAHAAGVVHRDLKPENVMLRSGREGRDRIKVLDFGIAKVNAELGEPALTRAGTVFGTPEYMSPEQASGERVDGRADLYALGILLYEMISGSTPFCGDNVVAVLGAQLTAPPPELPARIPPAVRQLVSRLLAKSPDGRFQSATELVAALDSAAGAGVPSVAAPSPMADAARRASGGGSRLASRSVAALLRSARCLGLSLVTRRVRRHDRALPLWLPAAAGLAASLLCLALLWPEGTPGAAGREGMEPPSTGGGRPRDALLVRAAEGDQKALAELRASAELGQRQWRALAGGYARTHSWSNSIEAYARLLELDPTASSDPQLLSAVYRALRDPSSAWSALDLADKKLGSVGADLLYDTYSGMRSSRESPTRRLGLEARKRLDATAARARASRALGVALDLAGARTCREFRQLLAPAVAYGDVRSLASLRRITRRSGCGFLRLSDCYSCLRHDTRLNDAIRAASHRPAPSFVADSKLPP